MARLSEKDLDFVVREVGGLRGALAYVERIARVPGPLSGEYEDAAERIRARIHASARADERLFAILGQPIWKHLTRWLDHSVDEADQPEIMDRILRALLDEPDLVERGFTWREIADRA